MQIPTHFPDVATSDDVALSNLLPPISAVDSETDLELLKVVPKKFEIIDEKTANWLVRRIHNARRYAIHVKEWAAQEQRRAEREELTLLFLFGRQLERWCRESIEKEKGRRKSLCLPSGTIGFRKENARLVIDDERAVLLWAKGACPDAVQVSERLLKTPVKEHFDKTGELPPVGAHLEPERETFRISGSPRKSLISTGLSRSRQ